MGGMSTPLDRSPIAKAIARQIEGFDRDWLETAYQTTKSNDAVAAIIDTETGIPVSGETIRRWRTTT